MADRLDDAGEVEPAVGKARWCGKTTLCVRRGRGRQNEPGSKRSEDCRPERSVTDRLLPGHQTAL